MPNFIKNRLGIFIPKPETYAMNLLRIVQHPGERDLTHSCLFFSAMSSLTKSMCWKMVKKTKDTLNQVGMAIYQKPMDNNCYEKRSEDNPPLCKETDDADAAWYGQSAFSGLCLRM